MSEALPLPGMEPPPVLTERQALALTLIRELGPLSSIDIGWRLRELRGGKASGSEWDASAGKAVGESLKAKGLVRLVVHDGRRVWVSAEWRAPGARDAYDPSTAPLPEGY